jgi:tRNA A37 methylthiotransferase MiaB
MTSFDRINSSSIDTQKEINFIFNGQKYTGFQGDTLASALIANGCKTDCKIIQIPSTKGNNFLWFTRA